MCVCTLYASGLFVPSFLVVVVVVIVYDLLNGCHCVLWLSQCR